MTLEKKCKRMTAGEFLLKYFEVLLSLNQRQLCLLSIAWKYNIEYDDFIKFVSLSAGWPIDKEGKVCDL